MDVKKMINLTNPTFMEILGEISGVVYYPLKVVAPSTKEEREEIINTLKQKVNELEMYKGN